MKLGYATTFDSQDVDNWSGTPFYMIHGFRNLNVDIHTIGQLKTKLPNNFRIKQLFKKIFWNERESPRFNQTAAIHYSRQVESKITDLNLTAIIAPQVNPIAYLDCKIPIVLWTDALYAGLINFYPKFNRHSKNSIQQAHEITAQCLKRSALLIFSSDWAAKEAVHFYGAPQDKIKVVPFGANFECQHTFSDIRAIIKKRSKKKITLLFIGKDWHRKGGDIVLQVAQHLHQQQHHVELHLIGCHPPKSVAVPTYIKSHGYISKNTKAGIEKISQLLYESHFLFVPSRAEAYGLVFCEANAFGLPCITTQVGGIETIVKNDINGKCFALDTSIEKYCEYILYYIQNYHEYEALALSSFQEYLMRLNWGVATKTVKNYIQAL
jgi:glycosyltransferase involved in cell wall biosynthesis